MVHNITIQKIKYDLQDFFIYIEEAKKIENLETSFFQIGMWSHYHSKLSTYKIFLIVHNNT